MSRLLTAVRRIWLPLFLLSALSWLFAPAYYHDQFGSLQYISVYESGLLSYSWLFRLGDVVSGGLLVLAPWLFGVFRRDRWLSASVAVIGVLSAVDGLFSDACLNTHLSCTGWTLLSSLVHDAESAVIVVVILATTIYHVRRYTLWLSTAFLLAQLSIGLLDVSGLVGKQVIAISQYAYEVLAVSWLAWLMARFAPLASSAYSQTIRRLFGLWTALNGALVLVVTLTHHRLLAPLFDISLAHSSALVGQHGALAGVLMLYLARHVYQGQRRAALLLLVVFGSQVIKYSVLTPSPPLLAVNLLSFVLLIYARRAFDRNIMPLPFVARLKDVAIVLGGALVAVLTSLVLSTVAGHGALLRDGLIDSYQDSLHVARHDRARLQRQVRYHSEVTAETLVVALLAVTAWSLFRPARPADGAATDTSRARALLERHSTSTEDFFKLWPNDKTYFFTDSGFVAYKLVGGIAFALPDPIAPATSRRQLLRAFGQHCRDHGWAVCFLAVPEHSRQLYRPEQLKSLRIGSSAVISVQQFMDSTSRDKWWRWQRNRGTKAGLQYELAVPPHADGLLAELRHVSDAWLADGEHREQGFALGYFDPTYLSQCRLHLLRNAEGQLVAFANELPTYGQQSQRTVDLIRYLPGQNGVMQFLLLQVIEQLHRQGSVQTFDLGFVPLAGIDSNLLRIVRRLAAGRFSSLGLEQFKNKFDPDWQASYLMYDGDLVNLARIATSLEAALKKAE